MGRRDTLASPKRRIPERSFLGSAPRLAAAQSAAIYRGFRFPLPPPIPNAALFEPPAREMGQRASVPPPPSRHPGTNSARVRTTERQEGVLPPLLRPFPSRDDRKPRADLPARRLSSVLFNACLKLIKAPPGGVTSFFQADPQSERRESCTADNRIILRYHPRPRARTARSGPEKETRRLMMPLKFFKFRSATLTGSPSPNDYRLSSRRA